MRRKNKNPWEAIKIEASDYTINGNMDGYSSTHTFHYSNDCSFDKDFDLAGWLKQVQLQQINDRRNELINYVRCIPFSEYNGRTGKILPNGLCRQIVDCYQECKQVGIL